MTTCGSSMKHSTFAPLLPNSSVLMSFATSVVSVMMEPPISISLLMCVSAVGLK